MELLLAGPVAHEPITDDDADGSVANESPAENAVNSLSEAYAADFDRHVSSVFKLHYSTGRASGKNPAMRLYPSINTSSTSCYLPRPQRPNLTDARPLIEHLYVHLRVQPENSLVSTYDTETRARIDQAKRIPGTLWLAPEKDMFFSCLARYSVHRLDLFEAHLPHKSRLEIEAYYHLLKAARDRLVKPKVYAASGHYPKKSGGTCKFKSTYMMEVYEQGLPYWRIPAAVEADESWVQFEEQQSQHLAKRELELVNAVQVKQARVLESYLTKGHRNGVNIVDQDVAAQISAVYRANNITPALENMAGGRLAFSSLVFFDELVRMRVRDIVLALLVCKDRGNAELGQVVSKRDVWRAVDNLRLFETKAAGHSSKYRNGKSPVLATYWDNIVSSLKLSMDESLVDPANSPHESMNCGYKDRDLFLTEIDYLKNSLEISDDLAELTATGIFEQNDELSEEEDSVIMDQECWQIPAPWEQQDDEGHKDQEIQADNVTDETHDPESHIQSPQYASNKSTNYDSLNQVCFSDLEQSEGFSRKRVLEDVLIEESLEQDIDMYTDCIDQRMAWRTLKSLKESAGLDGTYSVPPKLRKKDVMFHSDAHKAWARQYANYRLRLDE